MADSFRKKKHAKHDPGKQSLLQDPDHLAIPGGVDTGRGSIQRLKEHHQHQHHQQQAIDGEGIRRGSNNPIFRAFEAPQENEGDFDKIIQSTLSVNYDDPHQPSRLSITASMSRTGAARNNKTSIMSQQAMQHSEIIQKLRCESIVKWKILFCFLFVKSAAIINLLSISSLENDVESDLYMSDVEFGLLTGIVFVVAAFFSLIVPAILNKMNVYRASVIAQILVFVGQVVFVIGCELKSGHKKGVLALGIIYGSRVIFGCGFALVQVCTYTVVSIWFGASKWNSLALLMISQTVEIGILLARYATQPLYSETGSYWLAYIIGIVWAGLSVFTTLLALYYENKFNAWLKEYFKRQSFAFLKRLSLGVDKKPDVNPVLEDDVQYGLTMISLKVWLIMFLIIIGWANIETYSSQMTKPLTDQFDGLNESKADKILSASTGVSFVLSPIVGWIASKLGRKCLDAYVVITQITMVLATLAFWYPNNSFFVAIHCDGTIAAWISVVLFYIGLQTFYGGVFPLLFIECPAYLVSVANGVNAFLYLIWAFVQIVIFDELKNVTGTWYWSVGLIGYSAALGLVISFILLCMMRNERKRKMTSKTLMRHDLEQSALET